MERRGVTIKTWTLTKHQHIVSSHFINVSLDFFKMSWYPLSGHNAFNFFNEIHYIPLNYRNLLEYNYIIISPLNEFCELHIFMWKGVQEFFIERHGDLMWQPRCNIIDEKSHPTCSNKTHWCSTSFCLRMS